MRLTPLDIRHKEFTRAMRGYKDVEVDEFLDDIADEFERVFNENIDYKEKMESMEGKVEQYRNIEETLKKTLVSAQQQAEEMKQNAKKEADLILRDAELKTRSILNDSYAERQKIQRSVQALKQKNEDLRYQMRSMLETYMNILDQEGELDSEEVPVAAGPGESLSAASAGMETGAAPAADFAGVAEFAAPADFTEAGTEAKAEGLLAGEMEAAAVEPGASEPPAGRDGGLPPAEASAAAPAASHDDEDNPFADVEMTTEEDEFKW